MKRAVFDAHIQKKDGIDIIGRGALLQIASEENIRVREAEMAALDAQIVPSRYLANVKFFGVYAQLKLLSSRAAVIGCGAVGGMVCEILARLGIGRVHMVDFDVFDETNLNRQVMCREQDIGRSKVQCAKERAESVNSALTAIAHNIRLNEKNALSLIADSDLVFDGLDNARDKITLEKACLTSQIPLIHGAISDSTFQVATIRTQGILENIYAGSLENPVVGTPACTAMACATAQVAEGLKLLLGMGDVIDRALLRQDWLSWHNDVIPLL